MRETSALVAPQWRPLVPHFCSWLTRKSRFFTKSFAGHPGLHRVSAMGSPQYFWKHRLAVLVKCDWTNFDLFYRETTDWPLCFFAKTKCLSLMLLDVKLFWVYTDYVAHSPGLNKAFDAFWVHKYCCNNDSQSKLSREDAINLPEKTYNRKKNFMVKNKLSHYCSELQKSTQFFCCLPKTGLSLRARGLGFLSGYYENEPWLLLLESKGI